MGISSWPVERRRSLLSVPTLVGRIIGIIHSLAALRRTPGVRRLPRIRPFPHALRTWDAPVVWYALGNVLEDHGIIFRETEPGAKEQ